LNQDLNSDGDSFTPSDRLPVTLYLILQSVVRATYASLIHSNKDSYQGNVYAGFQIAALLSKFPFLTVALQTMLAYISSACSLLE
jgi:hypothetical protein